MLHSPRLPLVLFVVLTAGNAAATLRILLDRTSLEVFANDGEVSMTSCLLPAKQNTPLELYAKGAEVRVESLTVHKLRSTWDRPAAR